MSEKFSEPNQDLEKFFKKVLKSSNQPASIKYRVIENIKQKQAIKISKIPDVYSFLLDADILVMFNPELFDMLDEEAQEIVAVQELDKIVINLDSGKLKTVKPDVITFSGIINKYGFEKVARANHLSTLTQSQYEDKAADEFLSVEVK